MDVIAAFFANGHAAEVVLVVLALEGLWLRWRGWSLAAITGLLGPAALIVMGLRAALVGADWWWVAIPLALSFPLHLIDLRSRLSS